MHIFRRVVLPLAFLIVLIIIAALLGWIAFKPASDDEFDGAAATGEPAGSTVTAERGDISNLLEVKGTINVDPPTAVKAEHEGTVNHLFVQPGDEVLEGAELFQVRSEGEESENQDSAGRTSESSAEGTDAEASDDSGEPAPAAPPKPKYHTVIASDDGTVGDFEMEMGDTVSADTQVTELLKNTFTANAAIKAADLYRVPSLPDTATIAITGGPEPFDCDRLRLDQGPGTSSGSTGSQGESGQSGDDGSGTEADTGGEDAGAGAGEGPQLICTVPDEVTVYNSLDLTMSVEAGSAADVIVVPVSAVRGLTDTGTVWVTCEEGEPEEREVEIGLNDGSMVEVKSGLDEGEEIEEFVPGTEPEDEELDEEFDEGMYIEGSGL